MKKVLILEGGFNEEHQVSLSTGLQIKKILKKLNIDYKTLLVDPNLFEIQIKKFTKDYICFNALHGPFGEDGKIQIILKKNGFKTTHSSISSSKNCFNKAKSKKIIKSLNIPTPKFYEIKTQYLTNEFLIKVKKKLKKFIVKPNKSGSSFGVEIIKTDYEFKKFVKNLNNYKEIINKHDSLIFEEYISGKELTTAVISQNNKLIALDVTEIKTKNKYFDYKAKYTKGFSKHILPAKISKKNYNKCLNYSLKAHKILKCNSISRSDFIYSNSKDKIYYLETNTQPGMTRLSLVPEQAKFNKISFEKIILELLINAK